MSDKESENTGHSAYGVWLIYTFRAIEKVLPALKGKSKYGWAAPAALCILVLVTAVGFGIYMDGYVIHPPAQYTGKCPPPARITSQGCYQTVTISIIKSGTNTTTTQQVSTGTIIIPNSTGR